jgi:hypothetical protein
MYSSPNIVGSDKIENNEMDVVRSAYGGEERCIQGFGGGNLRVRDHLGDKGVDGRIRWLFRK